MDKHEHIGSTDPLEEVYKSIGLTKHEFMNECPELLPAFQYLEATEGRMLHVFDPEKAQDVLNLLRRLEKDEQAAQEDLRVNEKAIQEKYRQILDLRQRVDEIQSDIKNKQKELQELLSVPLKPREDERDQLVFRAQLARNYCVRKGFIKFDLAESEKEKEKENDQKVEKKTEKWISKKAKKKAARKTRRDIKKYARQNDELGYPYRNEYESEHVGYGITDVCYCDLCTSDLFAFA